MADNISSGKISGEQHGETAFNNSRTYALLGYRMWILRIVDQASRGISGKQQGEFAFKNDRTYALIEW